MQAPTFPATKPSARSLFVGAAIAVFFMLTLVALAEDKTSTPAPVPAPAAPAIAPTETTAPTPPAVPEVNGQPAAPAATPPADAPAPAMRRIDEQVEKSDDTPATAPTKTKRSRSQNIKERIENAKKRNAERDAARSDRQVVNLFADSYLPAGEKADQVIAVFGSATSEGEVADQVIAVFGDTKVIGPVLGQTVTVFGNCYINSHVSDQVVVVLGNLELGPKAQIDGEVICVGGSVTRDALAIVKDGVKNILGTKGMGLKTWFDLCFLKLRPLAFSPHLGWAWGLAFTFLALYTIGALLFRSGAEKCLKVLETRPGFSIITALLTVLIVPVLILILVTTGIGIAAIPFLGLALFCATLFGKMVMFAWIGRRITKLLGDGPFAHIAVAVLVGGLIVMMLYTVPILGALLFNFTGWVGMGAVIYTIVLGMKREKPAGGSATPFAVPGAAAAGAMGAAAYAPMHSGAATGAAVVATEAGPAPVATTGVVPTDVPLVSSGFVGAAAMPVAPTPEPSVGEPGAVPAPSMPLPQAATPPPMRAFYPPQPVPPQIHLASSLPRAGFWVRIAAMGIDGILIGVVTGAMMHGGPLMLPALATYAACMWYYKGTTIGGIICGLKVVRLDDRPLDWPTSIVRALACFLSMAIMGLGFIWVVFDPERQSWHDKIAGTTVVRMPKGVSLL